MAWWVRASNVLENQEEERMQASAKQTRSPSSSANQGSYVDRINATCDKHGFINSHLPLRSKPATSVGNRDDGRGRSD